MSLDRYGARGVHVQKPVEREVAVGELRLVRGWNVPSRLTRTMARTDRARFGLKSHFVDQVWVPGVNIALHDTTASPMRFKRTSKNTITSPCLRAPEPDCVCGLYGVFDFANIPLVNIVGVVEYWGRVRMGLKGVRAEFARITALAPGYTANYRFGPFDFTDRRYLRAVGKHYEAEVHYSQRALIEATAKTLTSPSEFGIVSGLMAREYG